MKSDHQFHELRLYLRLQLCSGCKSSGEYDSHRTVCTLMRFGDGTYQYSATVEPTTPMMRHYDVTANSIRGAGGTPGEALNNFIDAYQQHACRCSCLADHTAERFADVDELGDIFSE